jgi:spermidine/putrescine transport system substrate-binding protein
MTRPDDDSLNILAPATAKPKLDYLTREVRINAVERGFSRREVLGLGALGLLAAACGGSTSAGGGGGATSTGGNGGNTLAGQPFGNQLVIYNWSEYDANSTFTKFAAQHNGLQFTKTYYSSNDELLAKLNAGGTAYDIIVPSQNAVGELVQLNKLMKLDKALLPNLKNLDPAFLKPSYDPTGDFHVIKDYGITMFFFNKKLFPTADPKSMLDFYHMLKTFQSKGRTNLLDGAEEVVPLALMALDKDPNTGSSSDLAETRSFLLSLRPHVTTIDSYGYINDAIAGKIVASQGWNGDVRRIVQARKKQNDIKAVIPIDTSEVWADNWCIPSNAPHPVAAHAWINWLLVPATAVAEMNYHNYPIPIPTALAQMPAALKNDPLFNVPKTYTQNYKYILNPSPAIVNARTKIYTEFKAA